jgi:two-component system, NtrC family, response regulator HydG
MDSEGAEGEVCLDDVETLLLKKALDRARGNVAAAARTVCLTRPQMVYRLKSRGIMLGDG